MSKVKRTARLLPREEYYGNIEYKLKLIRHHRKPHGFEKWKSQLLFRLEEGKGNAIYIIGYTDGGRPEGLDNHTLTKSLENLFKICKEVGGTVQGCKIFKGINGHCANVFIVMQGVFEDFYLLQ